MTEHKADLNSDLAAAATNTSSGAAEDAAAVRIDAPDLAPGKPAADNDVAKAKSAAGRIMIMSPQRERTWEDFVEAEQRAEAESHAEAPRQRRVSAIAAVIALAAVTGAVGGSLATVSLAHIFNGDTARTAGVQYRALEEQVMKIDADIAALKVGSAQASKQIASLSAKSTDRFDRLEKAQAEPAARLAKLSEAVDKLRATPAPVPAPMATPVSSVAAKDVTGSISAPAAAPAPAPKPEVARLPLVEGWRLLDVADGGATIEGRSGVFEVYAGDPVPGLGRIDAIRKQDGRWTVVTSKGLIVAR